MRVSECGRKIRNANRITTGRSRTYEEGGGRKEEGRREDGRKTRRREEGGREDRRKTRRRRGGEVGRGEVGGG